MKPLKISTRPAMLTGARACPGSVAARGWRGRVVKDPLSFKIASGAMMIPLGILAAFLLLDRPEPTVPREPEASEPTGVEVRPPAASGALLTEDQIRYCLSENIRLEFWQEAVDTYQPGAVGRFNAAVEDYNARCGNYRYGPGALERVREEIEPRRPALQREGLAMGARDR